LFNSGLFETLLANKFCHGFPLHRTGVVSPDGRSGSNSDGVSSGLPTIREFIGSVNSAAFFILQWIGCEKGGLTGGPGAKAGIF